MLLSPSYILKVQNETDDLSVFLCFCLLGSLSVRASLKYDDEIDPPDCTAPFVVDFHTDAISDIKAAVAPIGRGNFSFKYS